MRQLIAFAVVMIALFFAFKTWILPRFDFIGGERVDVVEERAEELNKGLPRFVDSQLELREVSADGRTLTYEYRHLDYTAGEVDRAASRGAVEPALQAMTCRDRASRALMAQRVRIEHEVYGKEGRHIDSYAVTSAVCKRFGE
jgi:hypothetical protein